MRRSLRIEIVVIIVNPENDEVIGEYGCYAGVIGRDLPFGKAVGVIAQVISRQIGDSAAGRIVNLNPVVVFEEIIHCNRAVACEDFVDA